MGRIQQKPVDVLADYEAEPAIENSWNDEPLETEWIKAFEDYLNKRKVGPAAWVKLKGNGNVRNRLELIYLLTSLDFHGTELT